MPPAVRVSNNDIIDHVARYGFDIAFNEYLGSAFEDKVTQRLVRAYMDARRELAAHLCVEDAL